MICRIGGSPPRILVAGIAAAFVLGSAVAFGGVGTRDAAASSSGVVIALENQGPSPITEASLGFDLPPNDPGQTLDVQIGDPGSPRDLGELQFNGSSVSRDNPLPPGGTACIGPLPELVPGTDVEFEEVEWLGNGFGGAFYLTIVVDESVLPFGWDHPAVPGGTLNGTWRFLSAAPPACGPAPSVETGGTDDVHLGNVTVTGLGGNDGTVPDPGGDEATVPVPPPLDSPLPPSSRCFVVALALVLTLAVGPSTAAVLLRRRRRKGSVPPGTA